MATHDKLNVIADFLENSRDEMLRQLRAQLDSFGSLKDVLPAEEWFTSQVAYLRRGANFTYDWTATLVDLVRARGGAIHDLLTLVRAIRNLVLQFCLGRIEGVSDRDVYEIVLKLEDAYLKQIGELYSAAEQQHAAAERRREKVLADLMIRAFVILDGAGAILRVNAQFTDLLSSTEDHLVGQDFTALCDSETEAEMRRVLRQKRTTTRIVDGALLDPKGTRRVVRFWVLPLFDEAGVRSGAAIAMADMDGPGMNAEDNEETRSRFLEELATKLNLACYVTDDTHRILSANALCRTYVEIGAEDTGAYCCRRHVDENGVCGDCLRKHVFDTGEPYRAMVQFKTPRGTLHWVEMTCIPIRGERGVVTRVAKIFRDVTDQKRLEDQFVSQQRTSLASQLAMTVAHQLRNPLGNILGSAEMLSHGMPAGKSPTVIDVIMRNGIRCKKIVQDLLEFGRGAPGEHVLLDINQIICERVRPSWPASVTGRITWRLAERLPTVECSPDQLAQVFINLLDNGLRMAADQIVIETFSTDGHVFVKVWDDGPGVPKEDRERIFEPFFTTRKEEGGTGLGLSLSRSVVEEHRGVLLLDETVSPGACFVVKLPVTETVAPRPSVDAAPDPLPRTGRRILIIEDETDLVFLLTMALQSFGHTIDMAVTGAQAMELIQSLHYDAVIIDMLLADELGGRDLYHILLSTNPELANRSLFITGDTMKYETRRFLSEVKRPFLEKPFMLAEFTKIVCGILEGNYEL